MKWFACEKAAMEISREEEKEDKKIRRQDEVIVGERIELLSSGLSVLGSPGLQVRDRWGVGWWAESCSFQTSFTHKSDLQKHISNFNQSEDSTFSVKTSGNKPFSRGHAWQFMFFLFLRHSDEKLSQPERDKRLVSFKHSSENMT